MPAFDNPTGKSIVRQGQTWYCGRTHGSKFWCLHSQGRIKRIAKGKCLGTLGWQRRWGSAVGELDYALDAERRWRSLAVSWSSHLRQEPKCLRRQWPQRERLYSDLLSDMFTPGHKETQRYEWGSSRLQRRSRWSRSWCVCLRTLMALNFCFPKRNVSCALRLQNPLSKVPTLLWPRVNGTAMNTLLIFCV